MTSNLSSTLRRVAFCPTNLLPVCCCLLQLLAITELEAAVTYSLQTSFTPPPQMVTTYTDYSYGYHPDEHYDETHVTHGNDNDVIEVVYTFVDDKDSDNSDSKRHYSPSQYYTAQSGISHQATFAPGYWPTMPTTPPFSSVFTPISYAPTAPFLMKPWSAPQWPMSPSMQQKPLSKQIYAKDDHRYNAYYIKHTSHKSFNNVAKSHDKYGFFNFKDKYLLRPSRTQFPIHFDFYQKQPSAWGRLSFGPRPFVNNPKPWLQSRMHWPNPKPFFFGPYQKHFNNWEKPNIRPISYFKSPTPWQNPTPFYGLQALGLSSRNPGWQGAKSKPHRSRIGGVSLTVGGGKNYSSLIGHSAHKHQLPAMLIGANSKPTRLPAKLIVENTVLPNRLK